jgi:hypothetical protein
MQESCQVEDGSELRGLRGGRKTDSDILVGMTGFRNVGVAFGGLRNGRKFGDKFSKCYPKSHYTDGM